MVMSIPEKIASLKAEMSTLKGPGSKEKKKLLEKEIDALKKQNEPTESEKAKQAVTAPPVKVITEIPPYKKVTIEEVKKAEAEGRLCGFDPVEMTASIK